MREQIRWSIGVIFLAIGFNCAILIIISSVFNNAVLLITFLLLMAISLWSWRESKLEICVDEQFLKVGRAKIERRFIAGTELLDQKSMSLARTRDLDPAAYLAIRFWIKTGVKVIISDKRDPTPYWLISSKKAGDLVKALGY